MRRVYTLPGLAAVLALGAIFSAAHAAPRYVGVFEAVVNGKTVTLERKAVQAKTKLRALGFGGGTSFVEIDGDRSPVRFRQNDRLHFLVRVKEPDVDPANTLKLLKFKVKKNSRRLELVSVGLLSGGKSKANESEVPVSLEPSSGNLVVMRPSGQLEPGEYTLSSEENKDAFALGID